MNRTILERARSMRIHAGFPLNLWANAIDTVVYFINRGPSMALDGGIPEEMWIGKKVNYSSLIVFGCEAFAHIDKEDRKKLDAKSQKCYLVGYGVNDLGYRLWDVDNHKIIRSRDVVFNEKSMYKDRLQKVEEPKFVSLEDVDQYKDHVNNNDQVPPPKTPQTLSLRRSSRISKPP